MTASANVAFSARNPKPGWTASAPAASAASTTASMSSRSRASAPSVGGTTVRMPEIVGGPADAGRRSRRDWRRTGAIGRTARFGAVRGRRRAERVKRVRRDTPSTTDASSRQRPCVDPALDGSCRRPQPPCDLARATTPPSSCRDRRTSRRPHVSRDRSTRRSSSSSASGACAMSSSVRQIGQQQDRRPDEPEPERARRSRSAAR